MSPRLLTPALLLVVAASATAGVVATAAPAATTPDSTATSTSTTPTPAPNPVPPTVATSGVQSLSRTGATLTGAVTPGDAETKYHFQYGTSTSYGLTTGTETIPAGTSPVAVNQAVSSLTVGTTYHYRITATNAAGTVSGSDKTFSTQANPKAPTVSTQSATALMATSATLNAHVNPSGQSTSVTFQYGTSTKYGSTSPAVSAGAGTSTVTSAVPVASLAANTKYHFRAVAQNPTGTVRGSDRTFTTPRGLTGVGVALTPNPVVWNQAAIIAGTVGGAGVGGVGVALMQQDFPFTGSYRQVATQTTSSAGAYSFSLSPVTAAVKVQVVTTGAGPVTSPVLTLNSALYTTAAITKRGAKKDRLSGTIYPQVPAARISVQRKSPRGRWINVAHIRTRAIGTTGSSFKVNVSRLTRSTRYRIKITPHDGGAHVITTSSSVAVAKRH